MDQIAPGGLVSLDRVKDHRRRLKEWARMSQRTRLCRSCGDNFHILTPTCALVALEGLERRWRAEDEAEAALKRRAGPSSATRGARAIGLSFWIVCAVSVTIVLVTWWAR
jgi:hypothetical protein